MHYSRNLALLLSLSACASTSSQAPHREVRELIEARSGARLQNGDKPDDRRIERAVDELLARPLDVTSAVQIALLRNPHLRATLEDLSIAQADLVEAGLMSNPVFSIGRTAWEQEHISPNLVGNVEASFLDVITIPMKKRVASAQLEGTKADVADQILVLAGEVRSAYFEAQAQAQIAAVRQLVREAAEASAELARRQYDAGTFSDLALNTELALASQAKLDALRSAGHAAGAREELSRHLGLWGTRTRWTLPPRLPEIPDAELDTSRLEARAVAQRLDLVAARRQLQAMSAALSLAKTTRWTGVVQVNVEAGRLRKTGHISFGPSVGIEIPLFNQRQAAVARLEAKVRQARADLEAVAIDVRAEVRSAIARLQTSRAAAHEYGTQLVPVRERIVQFSQQRYDAMLLGPYQLLQAKQSEFDSYREAIEAQRDYWKAHSDLERAVGSQLGANNTYPRVSERKDKP